ncbi:kinase-like protein [Trametes cingulata]|nr:kinase-like protein [Trametes cingulata]
MASGRTSGRSKRSSSSSTSPDDSQDAFVAALDLKAIREVALSALRALTNDPRSPSRERSHTVTETPLPTQALSCTLLTPPQRGADNVVYTLEFSDHVSWVIRIPMAKPWSQLRAREMHLDIVAMEYIMARTSVPIPRLHAYSCETDNPLGHPYIIMDRVRGTRVVDIWHDASWWTGERRKENLLQSLAGYMAELATHHFDGIGQLDRLPDGSYHIVPFPSAASLLLLDNKPSDGEIGPFHTTHEFLRTLLDLRRSTEKQPWLALLQMFIGAIVDARTDGPPFALGHPDFNSQNIIVDDTGRVVGLIDWDGVFVGPLQMSALVYPSWLTIDWDPMMYSQWETQPGEYDSEEDLRMYRKMYADAIGAAAGEQFASITRNSHVLITLYIAITNFLLTTPIVYDSLGTYIFGSPDIVHSVLGGIEHGGWYTGSPNEPAELTRWDNDPASAVSERGDDCVRECSTISRSDRDGQTPHQGTLVQGGGHSGAAQAGVRNGEP